MARGLLFQLAMALRPLSLEAPALRLLGTQAWSGNLRQLEAVIARAVAFTRGP